METTVMNITTILKNIALFYIEGFKNMRVGKKLWLIIGIKFILFFVIMKLLFFPNILKENFKDDTQRAEYILKNLTQEGEQ
jgi:heme/copper-type cytochrome/quinol oxidase subunit 3